MPNKFSANCTKKLGKLNMQAVPVVFSEPCKILPAWGPRPSKQIKCIHDKKWFQRGVRLS